MRLRVIGAALIPLIVSAFHNQTAQQATIEDTGSTNIPGMKLTVNSAGLAEVRQRGAAAQKLNIEPQIANRLFEDLKAIGSLNALPRTHCMKSVSFGSSLYVQFNGEQSPDLNCPTTPDSKLAMLQKDVRELMRVARASIGTGTHSPAGRATQ